jgi:hypothetical protein
VKGGASFALFSLMEQHIFCCALKRPLFFTDYVVLFLREIRNTSFGDSRNFEITAVELPLKNIVL